MTVEQTDDVTDDSSETRTPVVERPGGLRAAVEAVLMVVDEPISAVRLASVLQVPEIEVERTLHELAAQYRGEEGSRPSGFEVRAAGGGWRVYSSPVFADVVGAFVVDGQTARLTQAALETVAVVAYRQPVTRGQVSAVRGVNVDAVMRTLSTRGLVAEVGQDPATGAVLYGTTSYFLERMGLASLDDLPPIAPHLPDVDDLDGVDGLTAVPRAPRALAASDDTKDL
ncbi:condensin subunit ScpB [Paraoerskovia marina]|uniref:Condensin subunit ScpB n=1 Tax=Paraoerskovia marina TaxID=545619 RepID=A0A1H1T1R1_9CELL|nr:SMC-Scp complex subunit ScpB [Paraoerskovia marina]SDS54207.1 condensin subunit ScpB [Paraoerskovia marina]